MFILLKYWFHDIEAIPLKIGDGGQIVIRSLNMLGWVVKWGKKCRFMYMWVRYFFRHALME